MNFEQLQKEIAKQKQTEQQPRVSEMLLKMAIKTSPLGIVVAHIDRDLKYTWIYKAHSDFKSEDVLGKRDDEITKNEGTIRLRELKRRVIESGVGEQDIITFPVSDGPLIYKISAQPLFDDSGRLIGASTVSVDITEQIERMQNLSTELQDAQEQLIREEKLIALGKLAGLLGHEIKTPMSVIKHSFEFLRIQLDRGADVKIRKHLNIVHEKLDTIDKTIDDILDFARTKDLHSIEIDPEKLVEDTLRDIPVPANIKIAHDFRSGLPHVTVDETQIQRAFHNIISNAIDAMDEGGTLTVSTNKQIDDNAGHEFVTIAFQDTGEGISPDQVEKVFEPLFSTKVKGTGLGLVACENVIHAHGGSIEVSSEQGKGSTFVVRLPVKEN